MFYYLILKKLLFLWQRGKNNVALIEKNDLKQFLETTNDLNLKINKISIVTGFNISKGRHVEIYIFQNQLFDLTN